MLEFEDLPRMQSLTPEPELMTKYDFGEKSPPSPSLPTMEMEMSPLLGCKHISQLLQLALALSLLRVDPNLNYVDWADWETTQVSGTDIGILELRATIPSHEYPHANRKQLIPLIEDLARFDHNHYLNRNPYGVHAYLLNVQSSQNENCTTTVQQQTQPPPQQEPNSTVPAAATAAVDTVTLSDLTSPEFNANYDLNDIFLNSDLLFNSEAPTQSIFEQTLADLNDYNEEFNNIQIQNLPMKDEMPEIMLTAHSLLPPFEIKRERASSSNDVDNTNHSSATSIKVNNDQYDDADDDELYQRSGVIDWKDYLDIKTEIKTEEEEDEEGGISSNSGDDDDSGSDTSSSSIIPDLTQEEMDLIEVLWKQDVDLGFTLAPPISAAAQNGGTKPETPDDVEKLKALLELKTDKLEDEKKEDDIENPWAGLSYTIDTETGEYVLKPSDGEAELPLPLDDLLLEEALHLADLADEENEKLIEAIKSETSDSTSAAALNSTKAENPDSSSSLSTTTSSLPDLDETDDLDLICDMMIQTSATHFQHPRQPQSYGHGVNSLRQSGYPHHPHHPHHQSRVPLNRTVSMEQRWQDLANLLSFPPGMGVGMGVGVGDMTPSHPHYPSHHYPYQTSASIPQHSQFAHPHHPHPVLHNASLADIGPTSQPHYATNLGSAVSSSMHLTNSTSETDAGATAYKMDHDMMYYSNTSSELNHTADGFLNSILNDEDLQLMDMAVNEGMYTMRMLDHNATSNNSSVLGGVAAANVVGHNANNPNLLLGGGQTANPMQSNLVMNGQNVVNGAGVNTHLTGSTTGDRLDASSDSAVSSMGSERVPSLSDGEWGDAGSDSAQEYHHTKYGGPYDYSYSSRLIGPDGVRQPPVAQKKHHMFAKRYFQEQSHVPTPQQQQQQQPNDQQQQQPLVQPPQIKYEYEPYGIGAMAGPQLNLEGAVGGQLNNATPIPTNNNKLSGHNNNNNNTADIKYPYLDFGVPNLNGVVNRRNNNNNPLDSIAHNHTYTMPPHGNGATPKPQQRDKKHHSKKSAEDEHLTRDEKRARSLQIPITVNDIINLPMDEFNERLSKYDLSENQLSLIRDIRRRGKNKVAAQNCRKRKLDQIVCLADEVKEMKMRKDRLLRDREIVLNDRRRIKDQFTALYRHVFQNLRDADGNPYSSYQYSLQQSADGSVVLVPRTQLDLQQDASNNSTTSTNSSASSSTTSSTSSSLHQQHNQQQQHQHSLHQHQHPHHQQQQQQHSHHHHHQQKE